jgi:hypothetical protein
MNRAGAQKLGVAGLWLVVSGVGGIPAAQAIGSAAHAVELVQPEKSKGAKVDLRPRFAVGQEVRLRLSTEEVTKTTLAGESGLNQDSSSSREMVISLKCTGKEEKNSIVEMKIESLKATMKGAGIDGADGSFDSTAPMSKDGQNPLAGALRPLVGQAFTLVFDADGNITSVKGNEKLGGSAIGGMAGQLGSMSGVQMLLSPITTPGKSSGEASVGQTWTTRDVIDSPFGRLNMTTDYKLASHMGNVADVPIKGTLVLDSESGGLGQGLGVKLKKSDYSGRMKWDTDRGMIQSMDVSQSIALEASPGGQSVSFTQTNSTKITRLSAGGK